jgi:hypothetical protein
LAWSEKTTTLCSSPPAAPPTKRRQTRRRTVRAWAYTRSEAESGDLEQSFEVPGKGNNFNQNAAVQGVANTGNAQNVINISQADSEGDDFAFEDAGATIEVSPTLESTSDQRVDQDAPATG